MTSAMISASTQYDIVFSKPSAPSIFGPVIS
jgi:hypothetical protein